MALVKAQAVISASLKKLLIHQEIKGLPFVAIQVRFRKPKWLVPQRAPSKQGIFFHKPKPTEHDLVRTELAYKSYNEMLKSIVAVFQEDILLKEEKGAQEANHFDEDAYHAKCMAYNDAYNAKLRAEREKRLPGILEKQETDLRQEEEILENELRAKLKVFDDKAMEALNEHSNWVTLDNLDNKINEAMDNIINFNFAVQRDGTIATRTLIP